MRPLLPLLGFIWLLFTLPQLGHAQTPTTHRAVTGTTLTVKGTSTLHDWHMTSTSIDGQATFAKGDKVQLTSLMVKIPVKTLKSDKEAMDNNAYKAMNADKFPTATFVASGPATADGSSLAVAGNLTINGTTKPVTLKVATTRLANGSLSCTGTTAMKMSDFGVKAPVLMFGTLKTGDDITIEFTMVFAANPAQ